MRTRTNGRRQSATLPEKMATNGAQRTHVQRRIGWHGSEMRRRGRVTRDGSLHVEPPETGVERQVPRVQDWHG